MSCNILGFFKKSPEVNFCGTNPDALAVTITSREILFLFAFLLFNPGAERGILG